MRSALFLAWAVLLASPSGAQTVIPNDTGWTGNSQGFVVNPATSQVYIGEKEVDGATHAVQSAPALAGPKLVDPIQDRLWKVAGSDIVVVDASTFATQTVSLGAASCGLALDPAANVAWSRNTNGTVTRVDGSDLSTDTVTVGAAGCGSAALVADPAGGRAFTLTSAGIVEIDRTTLATRTVSTTLGFGSLAVNPVTGVVTTFSYGPWDSGIEDSEIRLTRIDADSATLLGHTVVSYTSLSPFMVAIAADPVHGRVWYEISKTGNSVIAIDEADGTLEGLSVATGGGGSGSFGWTINPATNRLYLLGGFNPPPGQLAILDADTGGSTVQSLSSPPYSWNGGALYANGLALDAATNRFYMSRGHFSGAYSLVETPEPETAPVPITTVITNDPPTGGSVTLHFEATSSFAPVAPPIQRIFYRVDGTRGPWASATPDGPSGSATVALPPGPHTVYAFAVDGQEATIGARNAPIIGQIASLAIEVPGPPACSNGLDDDGDGSTDYPADPGCKTASGALEDPQCNNGLDDDADLMIDHPDDTLCRGAWDNDEASNPGCGLGAELALLLAVVARRWRPLRTHQRYAAAWMP